MGNLLSTFFFLPFSPGRPYLLLMENLRLCVFCSSSIHLPDPLRRDAEALADRILEGGGTVVGVIPEFLRTEELAHEGLTQTIVTGSMHERKMEMSRLSDAFAVLPGGFGTMDEFFEILTWKQLGLHSRPILVANTEGWFDPVLEFCRRGLAFRTISETNLGLFEVVPNAPDVVDLLPRLPMRAAARRRGFRP